MAYYFQKGFFKVVFYNSTKRQSRKKGFAFWFCNCLRWLNGCDHNVNGYFVSSQVLFAPFCVCTSWAGENISVERQISIEVCTFKEGRWSSAGQVRLVSFRKINCPSILSTCYIQPHRGIFFSEVAFQTFISRVIFLVISEK